MKRKIITFIDEKCNGCGLCIPNCPEGAIQIIDGKARLISDIFCDGLGACIGHCPEGAIKVEEREAAEYDEKIVMKNIAAQGVNTIAAHLHHLYDHNETKYLNDALSFLNENNIEIPDYKNLGGQSGKSGCLGSQTIDLSDKTSDGNVEITLKSELKQWPVQLHLLNPNAPYFKNAELVVSADCVPYTYPDFHRKILKNSRLVILCPKLDNSNEEYINKLAEIFKINDIKSVSVIRMEVPCCGGVTAITKEALKLSGVNLKLNEITVSIKGEII